VATIGKKIGDSRIEWSGAEYCSQRQNSRRDM
jgi:hypothetical protein